MLDDENIVKEFTSIKEAATYIVNHKEEFPNVKSNKISTLLTRIDFVCHQGYGKAYGYG